jgi:hypothetical protein
MTKEVMKQALEALKNTTPSGFNMETDKRFYSAIEALEEALKQEQGEPYGYFRYDIRLDAWVQSRDNNKGVAFYTTPQQGCDECGVGGGYALYCLPCAEKFVGTKEWISLTEDEMFDCLVKFDPVAKRLPMGFKWFAEAIEAKLREKNT